MNFESFGVPPKQEKTAADILKGSSLENVGLEPVEMPKKKEFVSFGGEWNPYAEKEVKGKAALANFNEDAAGRPVLTDDDAKRAEQWLRDKGSGADELKLM